MREERKEKTVSSLAALILLGVFAAGVLSVLLGGAGVYSRLVERDRKTGDDRTGIQYIATRLRQAPDPEQVSLTSFGDGDALVVGETVDGVLYQTRVYCHDGWLMELFSAADSGLGPEAGEKLLPADALHLERDGSFIRVELTREGEPVRLDLCLRDGKGASS